MPKRTDIKRILVIGSGPIIIGQACEFDYSGTQACKALKEEGYEVILVNSNPATIMTDPKMADRTYIEPLTIEYLEKIIEKERPDALLPNLGGQTGLNLSAELSRKGILKKYGVEIIGVKVDAIERGEDRKAFKETMAKLGIEMPKSELAYSVDEAEKIAEKLGYPVIIRPAYTLGGTGGGAVYNVEELRTVVSRGISASLIGQVLVEESVLGWEELELEVVRDAKGQKITVCFIENVDPMGVHTGDSFCVAPMLTIPKEVQKKLEEMAYKIVDAIEVIGGCNVQFARDPKSGKIVIIEINPRTSRSSALASKATGFPIARVSTKLAVGITLDEIPYWRDKTLDRYTPSGDYVVVKFARWAFEKFPNVEDKLGTQMLAVGEVMSIGSTFKEALNKAIRSLEIKRFGLGGIKKFVNLDRGQLKAKLAYPSSERIFLMYEALRKGFSIDELYEMTKISKWFISQMKELVEAEENIKKYKGQNIPNEVLTKAKENGFSDKYIADLVGKTEKEIREQRISIGKVPSYCSIPVSGAEGEYFYSTYHHKKDTAFVSNNKKVLILGGGPNRIGQGIEFDYTCVHAAFTLKEAGIESIMINCNPETVSTDYDTSNKLYFEPLTVEDVLNIYEKEKPLGVIVQFGGQTPLNISEQLAKFGCRILGTSSESIALAEDREKFKKIVDKLQIPQPKSGTATNINEALKVANSIGYPLMVRPSFVLGGRGMQIVYNDEMLIDYVKGAIEISPEYPMLIDKFLEQALEVEVDALSDGQDTIIPSIMEHIELAGIHSGDSACVIPPKSLSEEIVATIKNYTYKLAKELKVTGLMNVQYAIHGNNVYILEANPRASRTVPLVSKVMNFNMAKFATLALLGKKLKDMNVFEPQRVNYFGVKESVFPFNSYHGTDPILGPEMKSTGEVLGLADSFGVAFYKSQEAAGGKLPHSGNIFISVNDKDKPYIIEVAKKLKELGFNIVATKGTAKYLKDNKIDVVETLKFHEGRPNIVDEMSNRKIQMVINTPAGRESKYDDSYIRKTAIRLKIPYITTIAAAKAAVEGIYAVKKFGIDVKALQDYYK